MSASIVPSTMRVPRDGRSFSCAVRLDDLPPLLLEVTLALVPDSLAKGPFSALLAEARREALRESPTWARLLT